MKHTFIFIDKLIILLKHVPRSLETDDDKVKAKKSLLLIEEYTHILRKLIESHKTKKYLSRLHNAHNKEVENWEAHVASTLDKLDSLLKILEGDAKKLARIIDHEPEKWSDAIMYLALGIVMTGLDDREKEMLRLRNVAVFEIHELEEIISHKKHFQALHDWNKLAELPQDERIIKYEEFFVDLLR